MKELKCLRCGNPMQKRSCFIPFGYEAEERKPFMPHTEHPVAARTVYICESCGYVEFNTNED